MNEQEFEKAVRWMMDKGYATGHGDSVIDLLQELEWQVAEREREACEEAVEEVAKKYRRQHYADAENIADECAEAIRARGEK